MVYVGRKQAFGFGKESVAGTAVSPTVWIPKTGGVLTPTFESATDDSGFGRIEEIYDTETTKSMSEANINGILRDDFAGHLFNATLGSHVAVAALTATPTGTPTRGDICYQGANFGAATWTGVLRKITTITGPVTLYRVSTTTGSLVNATAIKKSDDAWSMASVDTTTYANAKGHYFSVLQTNSHPAYTIYSSDPITDQRAAYGMINTFSFQIEVGDYAKFESQWMAKKLETTTAQTPAYTENNPFLAKNANVKFATDEASLNGATASCVQNFNLSIEKNLTDIQCFGSDNIDSLHNQQFTVSGDMEALFENVTLLDYVKNSSKKACRLELVNSGATAIVTGVYPSIYVDLLRVGFTERSQSDDQNGVVKQTLGFQGTYSPDDSATIEILLINDETTAY